MLKVLKFGGSSLADAQQFAKVKAIVEADESRRVVIVSAPGKRFSSDHKITDLLYLCAAHIKYGVSCEEIFDMIRTRYLEIAHDCGLKLDLNPDFDALWAKMQEGIEKDELASRGEYFSARLMAEYLGYEFLDAAEWVKFRFDGTVDTDATYEALRRAASERETANTARHREMVDYYTAWVHQIKTPIAAMRLTLQGEDTPAARRLMTELGRVEQYVDMALTYLRLEEGGSDYVIRTCAVDDVVRAAVRRFAGEFIDRRIALDYTPVEWETVTDGKWLTFVVEQLLSNALKYTGQDGTVRIYREGDDLCIRDSGMGIAPEDLPRVFDMGYTGQNGRLDRRSSGIGLYLCRRICRNLRHEIRIESVPGVGTTVRLTLGRPAFVAE